jgi:hypothetical protein
VFMLKQEHLTQKLPNIIRNLIEVKVSNLFFKLDIYISNKLGPIKLGKLICV